MKNILLPVRKSLVAISKWVINLKPYLEVIALFFAICWAVFTFIIKDSPNLKRAIQLVNQTTIDKIDAKDLNVEVLFDVKNTGESAFTVNAVEIEYWILPIDLIKKEKYFSFDDYIMNNKPTFSTGINNKLSGSYTPQQEYKQAYNFIIPRDSTKTLITRCNVELSRYNVFGFEEEKTTESNYSYSLRCVENN